MKAPKGYRFAGVCGVDAGLIHIGDPSYLSSDENPYLDWHQFCADYQDSKDYGKGAKQMHYQAGHAGVGVLISDFGGDGTFPVFIKQDKEGNVIEAKIVFRQVEEGSQ